MGNNPLEVPPEKKQPLQREEQEMKPKDYLVVRAMMRRHCLFSIMDEPTLNQCSQCMHKAKILCDTYVYRQYDEPDAVYIILDGKMSVQMDCTLIKMIGAQEYFGHDTLVYGAMRSESIRVYSDEAVVYYILQNDFLRIYREIVEKKKNQIKKVFEQVHFFNYLTNKERAFLISNTVILRYAKGEVIFDIGQQANSFHVIKRGTVTMQIEQREDAIMQESEYFGESAFLALMSNSGVKKSHRMGRAVASTIDTEVYSIGAQAVKKCMGNYVRSIVFFNNEKWALYRDKCLQQFQDVDFNGLLQLFNVKMGGKYTVLSEVNTPPKFLFIPLEGCINQNSNPKLYGSQFLNCENEEKLQNSSIVLTSPGHYAYAPLQQFREVLNRKNSVASLRMTKRSMKNQMTLTLKNVSTYSKKLPSNDALTVLIVQDMKFGSQFVVKVYPKHINDIYTNNYNGLHFDRSKRSGKILDNKQEQKSMKKVPFMEQPNRSNQLSKAIQLKSLKTMQKFEELCGKPLQSIVRINGISSKNLDQSTKRELSKKLSKSIRKNSIQGHIHFAKESQQNRKGITSKKKKVTLHVKEMTSGCRIEIPAEAAALRERDILERVCNRFFSGYYKCQVDRNHYYIFTEYIEGSSLFHILCQFGVLPQSLSKYYLASMISALDYLHSNNIILRDLKPENIIIKPSGHLYIVDLGSAKDIGYCCGRTNTMVGTPHYTAPQMIQRRPYGTSVDIWSLGVMLYEFLNGRVPFANQSIDPLEIYQSILHDEPFYKHSLSKASKKLLESLLNKCVDQRISSVKEIRQQTYLNDLEFRWEQFLKEQLNPPYLPQRNPADYVNVDNYSIFDLTTLQDWK